MSRRIPIIENILSANENSAAENRQQLDDNQVLGINVMASPGAGKTSTILRTIGELDGRFSLAVVEGDTAAVTIDADKIARAGMPVVQVNTGGGCHLDAPMLARALSELPLADVQMLIVENVGNLVCPAAFKLGTHLSVVIASVPEGDDKPYKYPSIYRGIDALILNKIDLLPYIDFDLDYFRRGIEVLNPGVSFFLISCKTGEGLPAWAAWLQERVAENLRSRQMLT